MRRGLRNAWKRWLSWSLPTKISIIGTAASVLSIALYFWDLKPLIERIASTAPVVRNISVRINNPEKDAVIMSYRGELVLWLPTAMSEGAPRIGGAYEVVASDAGLVKDGSVPIRAAGETRLAVKLMNQERLYPYLKQGDSSLELIFRRPDGSIFFSEDLPFTDEGIRKFYVRADMTQKR
jgi:hypothetical protein